MLHTIPSTSPTSLADELFSKLTQIQVGGCTCGTKTPVIKYHAERCHYRLASEIELLELDLASAKVLVERHQKMRAIGATLAFHKLSAAPQFASEAPMLRPTLIGSRERLGTATGCFQKQSMNTCSGRVRPLPTGGGKSARPVAL